MDFKNLETFDLLIKLKSFKRVGDYLKMPQSSISKRIKSLETEFGVTLFNRATKGDGITLTEDGEIFFQHVKNILGEATSLKEKVLSRKNSLRILTTTNMASDLIIPCIKNSFDFQYIDVSTRDDGIPFDLYLGPERYPIEFFELIDKFDAPFHLYASSEYIKRNGLPEKLEDIYKHSFVVFKADLDEVYCKTNLYSRLKEINFEGKIYYADTGFSELRMVENGLGIGMLSDVYQNLSNKELMKILIDGVDEIKIELNVYQSKRCQNDERKKLIIKKLVISARERLQSLQR